MTTSSRYGTSFLFKMINPPQGSEPIEKWTFEFQEKQSFNQMMDHFYKNCGFQNHYKNHGIKNVRLTIKVLDRSPSAMISSAVGKRLSIDTEEQWVLATNKLALGCAEVLVYIFGTDQPDATSPAEKVKKSSRRKRNFTDFYTKRNKLYDESRDGVITIEDRSEKD